MNSFFYFTVTNQNCTSQEIVSDEELYTILNCEIVMGHNIYFLTLYVGASEIVGGVTEKKELDAWLGVKSKGFLINRWLTFASPN